MAIFGNGAQGWKAAGFSNNANGIPFAGGGFTMFFWGKAQPAPSNSSFFCWGGGAFVHAELGAEVASSDQWKWQDQDNAFSGSGSGILTTMGSWTPILFTHTPTLHSFYVSNVNNVAQTVVSQGTETLTDIYIGSDEGGSTFASTTDQIAECALWFGVMGLTEAAQLMAGANPLTINPGTLQFYAPLRSDVRDYGPAAMPIVGRAPVFCDHPPVDQMPQRSLVIFPALPVLPPFPFWQDIVPVRTIRASAY